jgi:tetratricopeptide (TPR) repeat protein
VYEDGDVDEARRLFEESLAVRRAIGSKDGIADSLLALGELRTSTGDLDGARAALDESIALARQVGRPVQVLLGLVLRAAIPGSDPAEALAALEATPSGDSALVRWLLWRATGDRVHLVAARRFLDELVANAPPEDRASMVANVSMYREIAEAARAHGV